MSMNDPNRHITIRDLDDYQLQIEAMLDVDDLLNLIVKYTDEIAIISFLKDLRQLRSLFSRTARSNVINRMYVKYITPGSVYQLNIPHDIMRRLDNISTSDICIYDNLEIHVLISLREQYLSDFISSDVFRNYIVKKNLSFLSEIGYLKLNCMSQYMRSTRWYSMKRDTFDYDDFNFIRYISEDNNGYIEGTNPHHYISKLRYNILGSNGKSTSHPIHKYKTKIKTDVHNCLDRITSIDIHDPHLVSRSLIGFVGFDILEDRIRYSHRTIREIYKIPGFKRRETILLESGTKFKDNSYVIVRRSIQHDLNVMSDNIRFHTFGGWYIKPLSSCHTVVTKIMYWETKHCLLDRYHRCSKKYWSNIHDIIDFSIMRDEVEDSYIGLRTIISDNKL